MCPLLRKPQGLPKAGEKFTGKSDTNGHRFQLEVVSKLPTLVAPPRFTPVFLGLSREDNLMAQQYISHSDPTELQARIMQVHQSLAEG